MKQDSPQRLFVSCMFCAYILINCFRYKFILPAKVDHSVLLYGK